MYMMYIQVMLWYGQANLFPAPDPTSTPVSRSKAKVQKQVKNTRLAQAMAHKAGRAGHGQHTGPASSAIRPTIQLGSSGCFSAKSVWVIGHTRQSINRQGPFSSSSQQACYRHTRPALLQYKARNKA